MGRRFFGTLALAGLAVCVAPSAARGQADESLVPGLPGGIPALSGNGTPYVLRADEVTYDETRDLYEAEGHVHIERADGQELHADWMAFSPKTGVGVATGEVELVDGPDRVTAPFAAINLNAAIAVARDAAIHTESPHLNVKGESIERTGVNRYRVLGGTLTSCRCPPSEDETLPWEIEVKEAELELGGYGTAKSLFFKAFGLPILYVPWVAFPAKSDRQTGFLIPSFQSSSRNGTEIDIPFFWAARDSLNVLFTPSYLSKRGGKYKVEFDSLFGERGAATGGLALLPSDREVDENDFATSFSDNRWAAWLRADQPFGATSRFGLDLYEVSDNHYPVDFDDLPGEARNARFLRSRGWFSTARRWFYASGEVSVFDDLQNPNDLDRDDFLLQRFPDLRVSSTPFALGTTPLRFQVDGRYTFFYQSDRSDLLDGIAPVGGLFFDTGRDGLFDARERDSGGGFPGGDIHRDNAGTRRSEGDGVFQDGELLADFGQRLDLYPRVTLPARFGALETLSEVGYRHTFYWPDAASSDTRQIWTGRFEARMRFAKQLALGGAQMLHVVEPRLGFGYVSASDQRRNPLFIPNAAIRPQRLIDGDLRLLGWNPSDRVRDERFLSFQIANEFFSRRGSDPQGGRRLAELRVGTGYDLEESRITRLFAAGDIAPGGPLELSYDLGYDTKDTELEDAWVRASVRSRAGHRLALTYTYLREANFGFEDFAGDNDLFDEFDATDEVNQLRVVGLLTVNTRLHFFANGYFDFEASSSSGGQVGLAWLSRCRCWDVVAAVEQRTRPDDTRFMINFHLAGLGRQLRVSGFELDWDPVRSNRP